MMMVEKPSNWRPSIGDWVEVSFMKKYYLAEVMSFHQSGTEQEVVVLQKHWGWPQFMTTRKIEEINPTIKRKDYDADSRYW